MSHTAIELLPHRFPFLLVDRIVSNAAGRSICCTYCVPPDHPYLNRSESKAVFPSCLLIEALGQTAALCIRLSHSGGTSDSSRLGFLVRVDQCSFMGPVRAADEVFLAATRIADYGPLHKFEVVASVDGRPVARGSLTLHVEV
ncbi:MAG: 3-hydroxyacyl-ACP dehydratase FabZ family protein [Syntrophobacteraceae bacterium]